MKETSLQDICWRIIADKGYPCTAHEVFQRVNIFLRADNIKEYQVSEALGKLQEDGVIALESNRWKLVKSPSPQQTSVSKPVEVGGIGKTEGLPEERYHAPALDASFSASGGSARTGRWATFRRLLDYYLDCIEYTEMPQVRAYFENQDDTWVQLKSNIQWDRLHGGNLIAIPQFSEKQAAFQRNRMQRDENQSLYIGYPVELVETRNGNRWLMPILLTPVKAKDGDHSLLMEQDGVVMPNQKWLDDRFRKPDDRNAFLRFVGILNAEEDEDTVRGERRVGVLADKIGRYLGDRLQEPIRQDSFSTPDWKTAKPGIYNTCILSVGGRYKYT